MSFDYSRLVEAIQLGSTPGIIYANPSGKTSYIRTIIIHNTHSEDVIIQIYNVPDNEGTAGTASLQYRFFKDTLKPGQTLMIPYSVVPGDMLKDENETIQGDASVGNVVNVRIIGALE